MKSEGLKPRVKTAEEMEIESLKREIRILEAESKYRLNRLSDALLEKEAWKALAEKLSQTSSSL